MFNGLTSTAGVELINRGHAGYTCAQLQALIATELTPLRNSAIARQIVTVQECTNTLQAAPQTAAATLTDYKALCAAVKAAGFYTIAITCLNFTASGVTQQKIDDVNTEINNAANIGVSWDAVIDLTGHQSTLNSYYADNFHFTAAGYSLIAGYIRPTIQALIV
jgi:lysophospholipase L1-like esterase